MRAVVAPGPRSAPWAPRLCFSLPACALFSGGSLPRQIHASGQQATWRRMQRSASTTTTTMPGTAEESSTGTTATTSMPTAAGKNIVVIGAGPTGCLAAINFARRGYQVQVYEKRAAPPDPPKQGMDAGSASPVRSTRAFIMVLNSRSLHALEDAGVVLPSLGPHAPRFKGSYQGRDLRNSNNLQDPFQRFYTVDRLQLGDEMRQAATKLFPTSISFKFGYELQHLDFKNRTVKFSKKSPASQDLAAAAAAGVSDSIEEVAYDLLVGADGINSTVRAQLEAYDSSFSAETLWTSQGTYKTFTGLPLDAAKGDSFVPGFESHGPLEYVYFNAVMPVKGKPLVPRITFWVNQAGSMSGMLSSWFDWESCVDKDSRALLSQALETNYPHIPAAWRGLIAEQVIGPGTSQPQRFGRIVRCSRLSGPRCVVLGDAGHGITAAIGQGCNGALESCMALDRATQESGGDLDALPERFNGARVHEAHAMQMLDYAACSLTIPDKRLTGMALLLNSLWSRAVVLPLIVLGRLLPKAVPPLPIILGDRRRSYLRVLVMLHLLGAAALSAAVGLVVALALAIRTAVAGT